MWAWGKFSDWQKGPDVVRNEKIDKIDLEKNEVVQSLKDEADPFTEGGPSDSAKRDAAKKLAELENKKRNLLKERAESAKPSRTSIASNEIKPASEQSDNDDGEKKDARAALLKAQKASEEQEAKSKLAELKGEFAAVNAKIESERARYRSNLDIINRLTNFKRTPVQEGTQAYYQCLEASKQIKEVEAGAAELKTEKARLEATIKEFEK